LIQSQFRKALRPVLFDELMRRFFLEMPMQMSKSVNGDQFLIGDFIRIGVIA